MVSLGEVVPFAVLLLLQLCPIEFPCGRGCLFSQAAELEGGYQSFAAIAGGERPD